MIKAQKISRSQTRRQRNRRRLSERDPTASPSIQQTPNLTLYTIRPSPDKGLSAFATSNIPEAPTFSIPSHPSPNNPTITPLLPNIPRIIRTSRSTSSLTNPTRSIPTSPIPASPTTTMTPRTQPSLSESYTLPSIQQDEELAITITITTPTTTSPHSLTAPEKTMSLRLYPPLSSLRPGNSSIQFNERYPQAEGRTVDQLISAYRHFPISDREVFGHVHAITCDARAFVEVLMMEERLMGSQLWRTWVCGCGGWCVGDVRRRGGGLCEGDAGLRDGFG